MREVQEALRNVDTARNAFVNSDSTDDTVLRERYEAWRDAHNSLSETIKAADSTDPADSDVTDNAPDDVTDRPVVTSDPPVVTPAESGTTAPDNPPATITGTDIPSNLGGE